jgi:polyisoprenoid-binding protein YceI
MRVALRVFTYKEGLLSRVAHDLELRGQATGKLEGDRLRASVELADLRVEGAVVEGRLDHRVLDSGDRTKIEDTMRREILDVRRHPRAEFEAALRVVDGDTREAVGTLSLAGRSREVRLLARREQGRFVGRLVLVPSRWGIAPYRALAGALRLADRVEVAYALDADPLAAS